MARNMFLLAVIGFVGVVAHASTTLENSSDPVVDLGYARYKGILDASTGIKKFYGIRYAAAPVGNRRWRPPVNTEEISYMSEKTTMDASKPGPMCIQGLPAWLKVPSLFGPKKRFSMPSFGEDCLLLDVYVPVVARSAALDVIVQIHGGGFTLGGSTMPPGEPLVSHSNGSLIYVSIQYRLGPYGFLSSQAVKADGTANAGLLDQRAALTWVQNHISVFGGDPEKVTIMGQSAGGGSVTAQMMLYGGAPGIEKPPFRAAIAEYPWWQPFRGDRILEAQYQQLLTAAGCSDLPCLRNASESTLATAAGRTYSLGFDNPRPSYGYGDFYWGPSVDGVIIRDLPSREFRKGHFSSVPLLINRELNEGFIFSNPWETTHAAAVAGLRILFPDADDAFFQQLDRLYPESDFSSPFWRRQTIFGDAIVNCPTRLIADSVELLGKPVHKMIFSAGTGVHSATIPFLFQSHYGWLQGMNVTIADVMKDSMVSFALHQDPNKESFSRQPLSSQNIVWPPYASTTKKAVLHVNASSIGVGTDPDASARCDFWHAQGAMSRN